ncbi:FecR domain-containing protein [Flammeovirga yaeyamensis]|uniref:FecR domain-containing protein n=1 Tax=Flammeovirga yaeyamensis TaxID=367791 RepID=A0AAX1N7M4_9BACT|nr:FecR family protein [Flammeovirga yaeyamensis]MBB3697808.1 ferric-dicitrate binding protein FerR (iron transport regulator) [Flammeovirga yaeyamensis]NMF35836.1 FecR family protein [Flammeovirga yaeyamensis]QWG03212.1 FecR domain-containing protein [Flammeovirga yaeyamensis]
MKDTYNKSDFFEKIKQPKRSNHFLSWVYEIKDEKEVDGWMQEQWENADKDVEDFNADKVWSQIHKQTSGFNIYKTRVLNNYQKVAAVVLPVLLSIGLIYSLMNVDFGQNSNEGFSRVVVPEGGKSHIVLPDQSEVWINGNSEIIYPNDFDGDTRSITLKGEAHFDVTHNKKKPFIVNVQDVSVRVLGTSFNVEENKETGEIVTTLVEGSIATKLPKLKKELLIKPGQQLVYNEKKSHYKLQKVDVRLYTGWKDGVLDIDNISLEETVIHLSKWYGTDIILEGKELNDLSVKAIIKGESLEDVLSLFDKTMHLQHRNENNKVVLYRK